MSRAFFMSSVLRSLALAGVVMAFGAASALAQAPSMLGAPGLSPLAPDGASPSVVSPPELSAPPEAGSASSCEQEMVQLQQRREAAIGQINNLMRGSKNKKLDPAAACPRFRNLVSVENSMKAWMIKNKDWCSIPDQTIDSMKQSFSKTPVIAGQACNAAAQVAKMRKLQAQQGRQAQAGGPAAQPTVKLPSGPL